MTSVEIVAKVNVGVYDVLCQALPKLADADDNTLICSDEDKILCKSEDLANHIADLLDSCGYCAVTGYYDPEADEESGETDNYTGLYYVEV